MEKTGTIQGLFELINKPYVGCKVLASSIAMDKVYTKVILDRAGILQTKSEYIRKYQDNYIYIDKEFNEKICSIDEICNIVEKNIDYPMFIKPSNSGSSVGVSKAENREELEKAIVLASEFDKKILVEQGIVRKRDRNCSTWEWRDRGTVLCGEIMAADEFYSFDAKYKNAASKTVIPADISKEKYEQVRKIAKKAFKAIDGKGLSRVDFFIEESTGKIYLNEINAMPGFTTISMYPKLFENIGINYSELLDKLIELSLKSWYNIKTIDKFTN